MAATNSPSQAPCRIVILDFGSQYTQVIARRVRECQVYSEIVRFDLPANEIAALNPTGIILSGGPASVYGKDAPHPDPSVWSPDPLAGVSGVEGAGNGRDGDGTWP